ncbi:MAG: hypothetical protein IPJ04_01315 [Candidatus Eisenbacteria bacterium]|nr:hypothetical protein [Candidatus Eisenbacteria bacterium]
MLASGVCEMKKSRGPAMCASVASPALIVSPPNTGWFQPTVSQTWW